MNLEGYQDRDWLDLQWSPWLQLGADKADLKSVSTEPGLYRVRHEAYDGLIYIGETGRSVSGRIHSLINGVFATEMPYSDPHTASPCLWSIVDQHGAGFEVSTATPPEATDKQQRKALEDALLAVYRRVTGRNTVGNFGRMPPGYTKSGQRSSGRRGGPSTDAVRDYREGIAPLSWDNADDVTHPEWMGLSWSEPAPLSTAADGLSRVPGVYRIWEPAQTPPLKYIGQAATLHTRLNTHRRNRDEDLLFAVAELPEYTEQFQRRQAETDLLGAHWLACGAAPRTQY